MDDPDLPWSFDALAARLGLAAHVPQPLAAIDARGGCGHLIQDFRPLREGLEWRLGQHVWMSQGARPFVEGGVPHVVNNSGTLSRSAAALLLASLREHPVAGPIRVLEIGAGLGLFARLLLDAFARLCAEQGSDAFDRLEYWVTDASPSSVAHWQRIGLFDAHPGRVVPRVCAAEAAAELQPGPWHAVFANYVLDVLPAMVLRRVESGWEQLHVRCWVRADTTVLRRYTPLPLDELRARAEAGDPDALDALLPLLPLLESEPAFRPVDAAGLPPGLAEHPPGEAFTVNHGALQVLDALLPRLADGGFGLISDYAAEPGIDAQQQSFQRFGPVCAIGLNLPALEAHVRAAGCSITAASGDGGHPLRHRLVTPGPAPRTRAAFDAVFSVAARSWRDEPRGRAQHHGATGQWALALEAYREALERLPGDWLLLTEVAAFAGTELADPVLAAQLAQTALALNPWTEPRAWNVLGDALAAQGRHEAALGCHEQALRVHPRDARTWLALARRQLALGRPEAALQAVASGLACDSESMFRHLLLPEQARALDALASNWGAERAAAARRGRSR